ncbi:MAG: patatin-like phospholipase family protein [Gammaproteobacteria bacterium]
MNTTTDADTFADVLRDELTRLRPENDAPPQQCPETCADHALLMGLALSGGGIRSATFALGVIQALAKLRLLRGFDYLSTVSGGGYIGSWLSALIHRTRQPGQTAAEAVAAVERGLGGDRRPWCADDAPASECPPEHPAVRFLRRYSNYLTPRLGALSGDTLAAVSIFLRNLLLNQGVLIAFFATLLTLPYLLLEGGRWLLAPTGLDALARPLGVAGLPLVYGLAILPLLLAVAACALSLMRFGAQDRFNASGPGFIVGWVVLPALLSAALFAVALQAHAGSIDATLWQWVQGTTVVYLVPWVMVFWVKSGGTQIAWVALRKLARLWAARRDARRLRDALSDAVHWAAGVVRFAWQIPWTLIAGALGGVLFYGIQQAMAALPDDGRLAYALGFFTPLILLSYSLAVTVHIGLMKRLYAENDREWWARLGGFILLAALAWPLAFAVTYYAAPLLTWLAGLALAGGLAWAASSVAGVLLGKSALTGPQGKSGLNAVALLAPYVFVSGLAILLAALLHGVLASPSGLCERCVPVAGGPHLGPILQDSMFNLGQVAWTDVLWVGGACAAVFGLFGWRVDVNLFSLHGFYRNRLTRCYLGATRVGDDDRRNPHPFTGFDPKDDLPLSHLAEQRPFHIVNAAMNLTGGEDLAWQTRRAAAFAFTPGHTGYEYWDSEGRRIGAYRPTAQYAANHFAFLNEPGGILLGNVVATSGAAANPNMGYHSSAALSALMSVFNVRLGRWSGNPRDAVAWRKASPRFGGLALIQEVFGLLDSRAPFLNVSDGGHFENLGVYELVRRRCRVVVAVDAGCDPGYQFEDLANAIRKCWTDFGTRIDIDLAPLRPQGDGKRNPSHFAVGCIRYPNAPEPGVLVYIKASLTGDETSDVKQYADRHPSFPHQSTADQFFDENQFESYRELGRHVGLKVFAPLFSPLTSNAAESLTPAEIRAALLARLPDHPLLQRR